MTEYKKRMTKYKKRIDAEVLLKRDFDATARRCTPDGGGPSTRRSRTSLSKRTCNASIRWRRNPQGGPRRKAKIQGKREMPANRHAINDSKKKYQ